MRTVSEITFIWRLWIHMNTHEYEFENSSFTENRGNSILTVLGGWNRNRCGLHIYFSTIQNCIVVMCGYVFFKCIFPVLPCWFWNAYFPGGFSIWREVWCRKEGPFLGRWHITQPGLSLEELSVSIKLNKWGKESSTVITHGILSVHMMTLK